MGTRRARERKPHKEQTPTFLLELPLEVDAGQATRLRAHLEAGRQFYNAVLSAGQRRMRRMRADPGWQTARAIPRTHKQERRAAYATLRERYGFSEYAFHELAKGLRISWLAEHPDAVLAQTLATRAYRALNRVADRQGERYYVQLALKGKPYHKPKHIAGLDTVGLDLGPASIAIVPREAEARLEKLGDEWGRPKKRGKGSAPWKQSRGYQVTRRRKAARERRLAAHRKSLHGQLAHQIVALGHTIITEKLSYRGWQKRYGRSVGLRAPGMLIDHLKRTVVSTGGTLHEVPTRSTKLSQLCHGCGALVNKPLSQRFHACPCGIGPVQRDLYSAFLAAYLGPTDPIPSCARYAAYWEGAEARLVAAHERVKERAKEGQVMPRSMGISRAGARLPVSLSEATLELLFLSRRGKVEAWKRRPEPPVL
jgi:hypothetical protein